ncbi:MAG: hypothetical protein ABJB86_24005 [Bacteroidota bacterium]
MAKDFEKTVFYRSFMTCVFAGLIGTLICMIFDLTFVQIMKFPLSSIVNVSTLIFAINIVFLFIGVLYYGLLTSSRYGEAVYVSILILITGFLLWKIQGFQRTDNPAINIKFRWLSSGIIVILGTLASIAVPVLYRNKKFDEYIL